MMEPAQKKPRTRTEVRPISSTEEILDRGVGYFGMLANEIVLHVLRFVSGRDVARLERVCKAFRNLIGDDVWQQQCESLLKVPASQMLKRPGTGWKAHFLIVALVPKQLTMLLSSALSLGPIVELGPYVYAVKQTAWPNASSVVYKFAHAEVPPEGALGMFQVPETSRGLWVVGDCVALGLHGRVLLLDSELRVRRTISEMYVSMCGGNLVCATDNDVRLKLIAPDAAPGELLLSLDLGPHVEGVMTTQQRIYLLNVSTQFTASLPTDDVEPVQLLTYNNRFILLSRQTVRHEPTDHLDAYRICRLVDVGGRILVVQLCISRGQPFLIEFYSADGYLTKLRLPETLGKYFHDFYKSPRWLCTCGGLLYLLLRGSRDAVLVFACDSTGSLLWTKEFVMKGRSPEAIYASLSTVGCIYVVSRDSTGIQETWKLHN